ncbi:RNA repair transcriptional activator RtcR family protein [Flavobacterium anhuiense]|jgi:transcriptional regulator with PAS, ATPase and Fis domain|uniref:RNA repair transcriptional activator RtcR family protein n=1 Tax=Flavobacterium anhuiense TaxID=459526 RepID=UPI003D9993B6
MKTLISWVAAVHDFTRNPQNQINGINEDGPTYNFHNDFYKHDRHVILSSKKGDTPDIYTENLRTSLTKKYHDRTIETQYLDITDVIDISQIKSKVEGLLLREYRNDEISIFFSPGTSAMQIAWYLIHESSMLNTRLFQVRPKNHSRSGKAELLDMHVLKSTIPGGSIIKEESVVYHKEDYIITDSLNPIYSRAEMIAMADQVTTLIYGESGSGKEHLASYIHKNSARSKKPFITLNCSSFTDELLESRLFGYKKGSFTGAVEDRTGLFEEAEGGTIFLDEIGDISPYMQQVLLRVIQEKKILQIGNTKEKKIDVRIIAATNKNLSNLCVEGTFRWDLFYRLTVTELSLPPLRERTIIEKKELINFFVESKKKLFKRQKKIILGKVIEQLILNYPFPGNVREMENLIENLYVFNQENVSMETMPLRLTNPTDEFKLDLKTVEKLHIIKVLKIAKNKQQAAKLLGCVINTLEKKIKDYDIEI